MNRLFSLLTFCTVFSACSEYDITPSTEEPDGPGTLAGDTGIAAGTEDTGELLGIDDTGAPEVIEEECNGIDDNGNGQVDEGFDANANGIADCFEQQSYCTPFDTFEDWSYAGDGDWQIIDGLLREGRGGFYDAFAWLRDLGRADHFAIEVDVAWTGNLNDQSGIAWGIQGTDGWVVRWDDPQGDYERYAQVGAIDLSYCSAGVCNVLDSAENVDLFRPADRSFSSLAVDVNGDIVTVAVDGLRVLRTTQPAVRGTGPGVVGLYSNDNDGGAWFDNYCVWTSTQ